jgi:hypothetical protein
MKFKFPPKFTRKDIDKLINEQKANIERAVISLFQRVGEDFITNARNMGSYKDRTGNLRSSVGYVIMKNGLQLHKGGFIKITAGKSKKGILLGPRAGEDLAEKIQKELSMIYRNAIILIAVSGMNYSAAVEAKGFDVITGSSQIATKQLQEGIERIKSKISKAA